MICSDGGCSTKNIYLGLGLGGVGHVKELNTNVYLDTMLLGSSKSPHGSFGIATHIYLGYRYQWASFVCNMEVFYQPAIYTRHPYNIETRLNNNIYYFSINSDFITRSHYGMLLSPGIRIAPSFYLQIITGIAVSQFSEYNTLRRNTINLGTTHNLPSTIVVQEAGMPVTYVREKSATVSSNMMTDPTELLHKISENITEDHFSRLGYSYGMGIYFDAPIGFILGIETIMTNFGTHSFDQQQPGLERHYVENKILSVLMKIAYRPLSGKNV